MLLTTRHPVRKHHMTWPKCASWKLYIMSAVYCAVVFADSVCWSAAGCRGIGLAWIRISLVSFRNSQNAGCRLYYSGVMSVLKHLKLYLSHAWANSLTLEVGPGVFSLWLVLSLNLTLNPIPGVQQSVMSIYSRIIMQSGLVTSLFF